MSSDKVYYVDYASLLEADFMQMKLDTNINKTKYIINPKYKHVANKIVIIDLPIEVPIEALMHDNQIVARFPIVPGIEVQPLGIPKDRKEVKLEDFSNLILNVEMLTDFDLVDVVMNNEFLVGIDTEIDGYITLVGYVLLLNKLENLTSQTD